LEALRSGSFHDPQWVGRLLDIFASYYFNALDIHGKSPVATPSVWRFAFEVAEKPDAFVAQHLLLGVNAHINYDLTVALIESLKEDWPQMNSAVKRQRYEDHTLVNKTIEKTFDEAQHLVVARYSPALDRLHHLSRDIDDLMISSLIRSWREQAWQHAVTFLDASAWKDRHAVMQETEYIALRRADVIMLRQGPIKMKRLL